MRDFLHLNHLDRQIELKELKLPQGVLKTGDTQD